MLNRPGPRIIDRLYGLFGVPSATHHLDAINKLKVGDIIEREVQQSSKALTDAARQLECSLLKRECDERD